MVLGTFAKETGLYGAEDVTVKPDGRELSEAISEAISRLPKDFYINPEYTEEADAKEEVEVDYDVKPMNLKAVNGKVYMRVGDSMVEQPLPPFPKDAYQRIADMIDLRKQLRYVLDIQVEGCSDEILEREQRKLNAQYDRFVKRFGNVNGKTNARLFKPDGDSALLFACENVSEDEETVTKADIFFKRTIRPYTAVTSTDDCFEALQISKNERGAVDISYIEELTKRITIPCFPNSETPCSETPLRSIPKINIRALKRRKNTFRAEWWISCRRRSVTNRTFPTLSTTTRTLPR